MNGSAWLLHPGGVYQPTQTGTLEGDLEDQQRAGDHQLLVHKDHSFPTETF